MQFIITGEVRGLGDIADVLCMAKSIKVILVITVATAFLGFVVCESSRIGLYHIRRRG
jgi:hypothetical protein